MKGEILRRLIVITCLVGSFLVIAFTGGGEASTSGTHAAATTAPLQILRAPDGEVLSPARVRGASITGAHAAASIAPLQILRAPDGEVLARARVRIHGRAFWFIIDTGSASSLVNLAVARQLHLGTVGRPIKVTGVGCSETAHRVRLSNWSIGGHPLPKITATSSMLTQPRLAVGLLGSDVLSRFGVFGIDYAHGVLILG